MSTMTTTRPTFNLEAIPGIVSVGLDDAPGFVPTAEDEAMFLATVAADEWARETLVGLAVRYREDTLAAHRAWDAMTAGDRRAIASYLDSIGWEMADRDERHRFLAMVFDAATGWDVDFPEPKPRPMSHEELLDALELAAAHCEGQGGAFGAYMAAMIRDHKADVAYFRSATWEQFTGRRDEMTRTLQRCGRRESLSYEDAVL